MKRQTTRPDDPSIRMSVVLLFVSSSLLLCGMVYSVDIDGHNSNTACSGAGSSCKNIPRHVCCGFSGLLPRAVRIGYLNVYDFGMIYSGDALVSCRTSKASQSGQGRRCFLGHGSVWGANWYSIRSAQEDQQIISDGLMLAEQTGHLKLSSDESEGTCTSTMLPNAVIYSSDYLKGKWVLDLHADKHAALLSELESLEDLNKEHWLQSQGAYYVKDEPEHIT